MIEIGTSLRRNLSSNLESFTKKVFSTVRPGIEFLSNWHLGLIAEYLLACQSGQIKRLIINQPPRTLKSINVSVSFPAWLLGHNPRTRILCSSYGKELSTPLSIDCRLVVESAWYRDVFPGTIISTGENEKTRFYTTERGGRESTSYDGKGTGLGGDYLIADDPLKAADADSSVYRERIINWLTKTWYSRMDDPSSGVMILNMQRLHEEDPTGYLLDQEEGWELLKIPMEAPTRIAFNYPLSSTVYKVMEEGEILHPERFPRWHVENLKKNIHVFSTQQQQEPSTPGGNIFRSDHFQFYKELPEIDSVLQSWDTAFKTNENNDYSVCTTWGIKNTKFGKHFYLIHVLRKRLRFSPLKRMMISLADKYAAYLILIEDKMSGQSAIQDLRESGDRRIKAIQVDSDKIARASAPSSMVESGCVFFPEKANWLKDFINELLLFKPGCSWDDQVDSFTQALNFMNKPIRKLKFSWL